MINSKQRKYLKSLTHSREPLLQIGKYGLTEGAIAQLNELLEAHELVKIRVLNNSPVEVEEIVEEILDKTESEFVQKIGNKLTLYRESKDNKVIELP